MPITISKADSHHGFPLLTILTLLLKGNLPTVKISHISIIMYAMRKTCISLDSKMSVAGPKIMDFTRTFFLPLLVFFLISRKGTQRLQLLVLRGVWTL
jgi:hypothetical protein